jgi:type IV pilus assembly protein PilA
MKKNNKGFTLIELLVVVAIIGILAAVGTVAYTGYTASAKKSSAKSNHASAVKYIAAEDQKCNAQGGTAMGGELTCEGRTGGDIATAATTALSDFKNPFSTSNAAVRSDDAEVSLDAVADKGYVNVVAAGNTITVTTCFDDSTDGATDASCSVDADRVSNAIEVAE